MMLINRVGHGAGRDVRVNLRRLNACVTKQHLDRAQISAIFKQRSGARVAEPVRTDGLGDTGFGGPGR